MSKMTFETKVDGSHFQYQLTVQNTCLVQIWWFHLKSVSSYSADKVKFTDGRAEWRTAAGNDRTFSAWKVKG